MVQCSLRIYPLSFAVRKTATRSSTAERAMTAWWCIFWIARRSWTLSRITRLGTNDCSESRIRSSLCPFGCYLPISLYAWHQTRTLKNSLTSNKSLVWLWDYVWDQSYEQNIHIRGVSPKDEFYVFIMPFSFSQWLELLSMRFACLMRGWQSEWRDWIREMKWLSFTGRDCLIKFWTAHAVTEVKNGFCNYFPFFSTKSVALFILSKTHELSYNIFVPITSQESLIPERKCRCERLVLQPAVVKAYSTVCWFPTLMQQRKGSLEKPKCVCRNAETDTFAQWMGFSKHVKHIIYTRQKIHGMAGRDPRYGDSEILNLNLNSIFNVTPHILLGRRLPASWRYTQGAPAEKLPNFQGIDVHFWGDDKNNSAQRELRKVTEAAR